MCMDAAPAAFSTRARGVGPSSALTLLRANDCGDRRGYDGPSKSRRDESVLTDEPTAAGSAATQGAAGTLPRRSTVAARSRATLDYVLTITSSASS